VPALHIDPESAFLEYLAMYDKLGRAGRALDRFGVTEFATTIAPGVRDVLLTGKVYEATRRTRAKGAIAYDAVVLDAPPTGRITQFLGVNSELSGLAKVGPVKGQADKVMRLLTSSETAVHVVTLLEEMPVQETVDGIADLRAHGLPVGGGVVNLVRPQDLDPKALTAVRKGKVDRAVLAADLERGGLEAGDLLLDGLLHEAADHAERRALEDAQREVVAGLDLPTYELPRLADGIDPGALYELAALLRDQGAA
jgi:anion-transporting  ArsA/GET3 family ATPase